MHHHRHHTSRMHDLTEQARERLAPFVDELRTQAGDKLGPAAESAASTARDKFDQTAPKVGATLTAATVASQPVRKEAKRRAAATLAAARGELELPKESHKLRNLLLLLGLGGLVAVAVKYFQDDNSATWESDYPTSGPTAVPDPAVDPSDPLSPPTAVSDDAAAASPDVALADATEHPHRPTDPDDPLERRDL